MENFFFPIHYSISNIMVMHRRSIDVLYTPNDYKQISSFYILKLSVEKVGHPSFSTKQQDQIKFIKVSKPTNKSKSL